MKANPVSYGVLLGPPELFAWVAQEFGGVLIEGPTNRIYACSDGALVLCQAESKGQVATVARKLTPEQMSQLDPELAAAWKDHRGGSTIREVTAYITSQCKVPVEAVVYATLLNESLEEIRAIQIPRELITSRVGDLQLTHKPLLVSGCDGGAIFLLADGGEGKLVVRPSKIEPRDMASMDLPVGKKTADELLCLMLERFTQIATGK